jgi:3',5'-cyclic AMP phosphodiesterase CpdA
MDKRGSPDSGSPLLSFGIISDTHIRSPQGDHSSPYAVNSKANSRAKYACKLLAAQNPEFVIHLGDMVHPLPGMASYDPACKEATALFEPLKPNLHYVAGNHDVGDKPMPGSPAAIVNDDAMNKYSAWFGQQWYTFDAGNLRIIVINSSLLNTNSTAEKEQNIWLDAVLEQSRDHRIILFSHYPLFVHDPIEPEHYDNIAEPGRQELLSKIKRFGVDTVFSGHVHHFFFNQLDDTNFFILPSTSFTRQDYADLFKSTPAAEFGRDDTAKYVVTMVDVYPDTCQIRVIDTDGNQQDDSDNTPIKTAYKRPSNKNLTLHVRHPWHETITLPYNGPMEEFTRKQARNDYTLLRLMQMGIYQLRIPLQDFTNEASRHRLEAAANLGFRYTVICLQSAWAQLPNALTGIQYAITAVEYVLPNDFEYWVYPEPQGPQDTPVYLGYAASGAHSADTKTPFFHTVSSGFPLHELNTALDWQQQHETEMQFAGIVVQIPWEDTLDKSIEHVNRALAEHRTKFIVNLKIGKNNPAESNFDEQAISDRICNAITAFDSIDRAELQLDTFMSLERGYAPRTGLVDRLTNLTSVGKRIARL